MLVKAYLILLSTLLLLSPKLGHAQVGCPPGYYPIGGGNAGWVDCAPLNTPDQTPTNPGPQWETRWGAIAIDGGAGKFGGVDNMSSKRRAEKAALKECKDFGGRKCRVSLAYYNQCGVLASGDNEIISQGAPELESAEKMALDACRQKTSNCKLFYSGCSYPKRIR
jgi:Domain of unknown function (DUF4189)